MSYGLSVYFYILAKTTYLMPLYGYKHYLSHIYHLIDVTYIYLYVLIKKHINKKHINMEENKGKLTTQTGAPVPDNQNAQTAAPRGPLLMQDFWILEKMANFDREVIPERRMHAKGSGAFGTFTVTHDITQYTKAS